MLLKPQNNRGLTSTEKLGDIKEQITDKLRKQIKSNRHIIGVAAGSGLTAKYAVEGGADFILSLSSGYFRQIGVSSLAGYLPAAKATGTVRDL